MVMKGLQRNYHRNHHPDILRLTGPPLCKQDKMAKPVPIDDIDDQK